jgi:hypothetical protein
MKIENGIIVPNSERLRELEKQLGETFEGSGWGRETSRIQLEMDMEKGLVPEVVHELIAKTHGPYEDFRGMMDAYHERTAHLDVTGAIRVVSDHAQKMRLTGRHYLPIIDSMNMALMNFAQECAGSTK